MRSHDFTCAKSIAHRDQTKSSTAIENIFPRVLKDPILRKVQFSTISRIDDLGNSADIGPSSRMLTDIS